MNEMTERLLAHTTSGFRDWLQDVGPQAVLCTLAELVGDAAVFAVDADRNVILWSSGAERLLGYRADEVLNGSCLRANRCHQCVQGCGISEHNSISNKPMVLYSSTGVPVKVHKHARAFWDDAGRFVGGIEVLVPAAQTVESFAVATREEAVTFYGMVSRDKAMHQVFQIIRNVAETDSSVLIRGESGTGKELVARAVHALSHRHKGPFVAVNCAALTPSLMESELFGHVRGAFTGAVQNRAGLFEQANQGTLFLDEIAELPYDMQAKLLRVLEERRVVPVGGTRPLQLSVRVVAATHRSLREQVAAGRFREDLLYRLRVVPLFLPPLRQRTGDIDLLLWYFIGKNNVIGPRVIDQIAPDVMRALYRHPWPGNIRELRNVVDYAFAVGRGKELLLSELPFEFQNQEMTATNPDAGKPFSQSEEQKIRAALELYGNNIGQVAESLGMSRPTLWRKRKKYGI